MTKFPQLSPPMVSCGAGFHADQTGQKLGEVFQDLPAPQLTANDNFAVVVNAVYLKNVLRNIKTDRATFTHGWLPSCGSNDTAFWHIAMPVEEPSTASALDTSENTPKGCSADIAVIGDASSNVSFRMVSQRP